MHERERLQQIMKSENLNSKQFAEEIGVSIGTISNIMGGRNNPSLDVMRAILNRFRTINSDWLILGIGAMYRMNGDGPQTALFDIPPIEQEPKNQYEKWNSEAPAPAVPQAEKTDNSGKRVAKIVIFYTDGSFEER